VIQRYLPTIFEYYTIDNKFQEKENGLASKQDIHALKEDMTRLELKIAESKTDN
jgi:hypothetical protein